MVRADLVEGDKEEDPLAHKVKEDPARAGRGGMTIQNGQLVFNRRMVNFGISSQPQILQ